MKYYDGMGRDVTSYVMDLERENAELKEKITFLSNTYMDELEAESLHIMIDLELQADIKAELERQIKSLEAKNMELASMIEAIEKSNAEKVALMEEKEVEPSGVVIEI